MTDEHSVCMMIMDVNRQFLYEEKSLNLEDALFNFYVQGSCILKASVSQSYQASINAKLLLKKQQTLC